MITGHLQISQCNNLARQTHHFVSRLTVIHQIMLQFDQERARNVTDATAIASAMVGRVLYFDLLIVGVH
jgi:hypothetical protein